MAKQLKITAFFNSPASETSPSLSARKQMQEHLNRNLQQKSSPLDTDTDTDLDSESLDVPNKGAQSKPARESRRATDQAKSKPKPKPKAKRKPRDSAAAAAGKRPPAKRRPSPEGGENQVPTIVLDSGDDRPSSDADSEDSMPVRAPRGPVRAHLDTLESSPEPGKQAREEEDQEGQGERTPKRRRIRRIISSSESSREPSPAARASSPLGSQGPIADGIIGMKVRSPNSNGSP